MSIFTSSRNLKGQSFAHGLAPFDPLSLDSDEFVETPRLSILIDEEGEVNVSGPVRLFAGTDPIDSDEIPTFSKGNKFVAGLEKVLPGVPAGGIIAYTEGRGVLVAGSGVGKGLPEGFARTDGKIYRLAGGGTWVAPIIPPGVLGTDVIWIVRLPAGAEATGGRVRRANIGN
jgi:hypothetical protein